jgi:uncharacterized protein
MKAKTSLTQPSRYPKRMDYSEETINAILDEGLFCHVSFTIDGQPFLLPTGYSRIGKTLYLHGSVGSHFFMQMAKGIPVCVAVTLLDALVLARSVFNHSVNYRSVIGFGKTRLVENEEEKWLAAKSFTEHMVPGRWDDARQPTASEMKKTMFIAVELEEMSAKLRTHGVGDDPEDLDLDVWAGLLPLPIKAQPLQAAEDLKTEVPIPEYLQNYWRGK